jgi:hypothetical protein
MLLGSPHKLKPTNNKLFVEARTTSGGVNGNIDDFVIDNVVIMYKTQAA